MDAVEPSGQRLFAGARFDVRAVQLPRRGGGTMRREYVQPADAVVILPLLDATPGREQVVLIRNERFAVGRTLWELPAGTIEPGEDPDRCAARELIEETGYEAGQLQRLLSFYPTPGFCTERMHLYRAADLTHVGQALDETERITPHTLPLTEALAMIRDGRIEDAKTICGLLYHHTWGRPRGG